MNIQDLTSHCIKVLSFFNNSKFDTIKQTFCEYYNFVLTIKLKKGKFCFSLQNLCMCVLYMKKYGKSLTILETPLNFSPLNQTLRVFSSQVCINLGKTLLILFIHIVEKIKIIFFPLKITYLHHYYIVIFMLF